MAFELGSRLISVMPVKPEERAFVPKDSWLGNCADFCGVEVGVGSMLMKTCPHEPYTDWMCSWSSFSCCSVGGLEGEEGSCLGDCTRVILCGVRGVDEVICTGDAKKVSRGPGWGCLCVCATCIECCDDCPRLLVLLTVLSSCWKDGVSKGPGFGEYSWYWACRAAWSESRLRPRRSKLMPVRCDRRTLAGDGRTVGASKTVGVEFCRRCWIRWRWMPAGMFVDSISYAGRVRSRFSRRGEVLWGPKLANC